MAFLGRALSFLKYITHDILSCVSMFYLGN